MRLLVTILALPVGAWTFSTPLASIASAGAPSPTKGVPPRPFEWPLIGNLPDFLMRGGPESLFDVHESLYKEFGPVYGLSILDIDSVFFCDPRDFDIVYHLEGKYPYGSSQSARVFLDYHQSRGNVQVVRSMSDGEEWRTWRQSLNPELFLKSSARSYTPSIAMAAAEVSRVAHRYGDSMNDLISRAAFDMFCAVMLGDNPTTVDPDTASEGDLRFVDSTRAAFSLAGVILLSPREKLFRSSRYDEFVSFMDRSMEYSKERTMEYIRRHRRSSGVGEEASGVSVAEKKREEEEEEEELEKDNAKEASCPFSSALDRLLARNEMQDDEISQTIGSFLMAGVDTTAYVISWLWINLASNPSAQERLFSELETVLAGSDVTKSDLDRLPYLRACIRESHRLTPPSSISHLRKLPVDVSMAGYTFPAGTRLMMNTRAFQMDARYVDEPHVFRPERWLPDAVAGRKGTEKEVLDHRLLATPFGAGARMCLGSAIADIEIVAVTARVFQDWKISLDPPDQEWRRKQGLMVKADPFPRFGLDPRRKK